MHKGVVLLSIRIPQGKVKRVLIRAEGKKHTGNYVSEEDNAKWRGKYRNKLEMVGKCLCEGFPLVVSFCQGESCVWPDDVKPRRMLCGVMNPWWTEFIIDTRELEEGVQKLTEEVRYNDTSEDDEEVIVSMELINRNIAAFLRINKKAIRKWYKECLSAKSRYWQIKMNFWKRFKMYTWLELFFGEKTRGVDDMWKNKMWLIWFTYIDRMMWIEDVEDTNEFKKKIKKCYSYIYIRDSYTRKKRHFRKVKQKKIVNAWNQFLDSYMNKWEKERKNMAMRKCTARKKQNLTKQPVKKRTKVVPTSLPIPRRQDLLENRDDDHIGNGNSTDGIIRGSIDSSVFFNSLSKKTRTGLKENPSSKRAATKTRPRKSVPTKMKVAENRAHRKGATKIAADKSASTPKKRKVNERRLPAPPSICYALRQMDKLGVLATFPKCNRRKTPLE
ncbi:Plasmodium exported protein, unknown function [Plasmodium knowlesi strain H]|uniref:Uncharacterized protein n=3 Tax=Plasmodium knowlesi TaxID=5850 RepID=A0A5K1U2X8_PLAKH|nr:Plasmodium exported protein, unknown function [Plasmodium knowlesi strain H]OTN67260.1 Uncharacterized protein PKNOH_S06436300 [Plasmodium knowlesi]CAA9987633.1 Plasmodium exported protein, unknown function [Plasmodium knowlesi strain H]SBO26965.1 Plasmodium exported protein, unknown function [Plasmodium knowlesi strain H]SBO29270.1 Plasmodium exported protein, unknown function [Plasmodium knowlesi strain H]VVS77107.1 Plasmodium exported protein, unknown function [Plasmodium knowlesi strain|eukprot:XP_002258632.1 hypothetical protein, conserved in Plasmodium species [Plasmodium knowlesi strain H]